MTNQEAADLLDNLIGMVEDNQDSDYDEALKMAISALSEDKGEWILVVDSYFKDGTIEENHWECSKCGSEKSGWGKYKFCPDCGAKMKGGE